MSFIYSRALVEASSLGRCSDTDASVPSSGRPMPQAYSSPDRMTALSRLSRFGMTFAPLTADRGEALLTSWLAGFRAKRTAAHLEDARWQMISGRKCGGSWQMSLLGTYLPRTYQSERLTAPQTILSRWAIASDAFVFPRRTWVLTTYGEDIGYLHTPTCAANYSAPSMQKHPCAQAFTRVFGRPTPMNQEWLMGWPLGWTALQPLATDKFPSAPQLHSSSLPPVLSEAA